ncbi:MAG: hypothetical protein PHD06_02065 [Bacteroidales bacterium]|jgi:hypothetical protein|nr:hypothetical protein [Bacteroidales bacterium]MDD4383945.1 hypothetical protein [Bacteroidales bacterium]MDY0196350.1 hypothetical protein [Tenuifilaceae bacterium]
MQLFKKIWWLILLAGIAGAILLNNHFEHKRLLAKKSFALEDLSSISTIQICSLDDSLTLNKQGDDWIVNNSFKAYPQGVDALHRVLLGLTPVAPIPFIVNDSLLQQARVNGLRITIRSERRNVKEYNILATDAYNLGDIGVMSGATTAYRLTLPGFDGSVVSLFRVDEPYWKGSQLDLVPLHEIISVEVELPSDIEKSFRIDIIEGHYRLYHIYDGKFIADFDSLKVKSFLQSLYSVDYKELLGSDNILEILGEPDYILSIMSSHGDVHKISVFPIPIEPYTDELGRNIKFDPNNVYLSYQNKRMVYVVQYMDVYPVLRDLSHFMLKME